MFHINVPTIEECKIVDSAPTIATLSWRGFQSDGRGNTREESIINAHKSLIISVVKFFENNFEDRITTIQGAAEQDKAEPFLYEVVAVHEIYYRVRVELPRSAISMSMDEIKGITEKTLEKNITIPLRVARKILSIEPVEGNHESSL